MCVEECAEVGGWRRDDGSRCEWCGVVHRAVLTCSPPHLFFQTHQFHVQHLDGRNLVVTCVPGEVIQPDAVKVVKGEGFPEYRRIFNKGDLFIVYVDCGQRIAIERRRPFVRRATSPACAPPCHRVLSLLPLLSLSLQL